ncbi:MAG: hypothetical protein GX221_06775 [Candidatus Riflebacteria bacterium]|nr:hypothetical protein [Candidatus Riflebacteria bacterium]
MALALTAMVLAAAYKVFIEQQKLVKFSVETVHANESFRKVTFFMGEDIKKATRIVRPTPVPLASASELITKVGTIMTVQTSEIDPRIKFDSSLGTQIAKRTHIDYELELMPNFNEDSEEVPVYRLIRNAVLDEEDGTHSGQRQVIAENIQDLIIYRTVREPFKIHSLSEPSDRMIEPRSLSETGTGNNIIHVKMAIERDRYKKEKGSVYSVTMETSFYKRGKEIFLNP